MPFDTSISPSHFDTREAWLNAFVDHCRVTFAEHGACIPPAVRVAVGFTSKGARGKRIGECWADTASRDGTFEIFIVPTLDDPSRIADIVTHELIHAAVGLAAGHGKPFKRLAVALGLEGKMTATVAGAEWHRWADPIVAALGPLPHASLNGSHSSGPKKQTTRLLKVQCEECGLIMRASRAAIEGRALRCPDSDCGGNFVCDAIFSDDTED